MRFLPTFLLWALVCLIIGCVFGSANIPDLYRLTKNGVSAEGIVTSLPSADHDRFQYSYVVAGARYDGTGFIDELKNSKIGTKVGIRYVADSPNISRSGDIGAQLQNELISVGTATATFPILMLWYISAIWHHYSTRRTLKKTFTQ